MSLDPQALAALSALIQDQAPDQSEKPSERERGEVVKEFLAAQLQIPITQLNESEKLAEIGLNKLERLAVLAQVESETELRGVDEQILSALTVGQFIEAFK